MSNKICKQLLNLRLHCEMKFQRSSTRLLFLLCNIIFNSSISYLIFFIYHVYRLFLSFGLFIFIKPFVTVATQSQNLFDADFGLLVYDGINVFLSHTCSRSSRLCQIQTFINCILFAVSGVAY